MTALRPVATSIFENIYAPGDRRRHRHPPDGPMPRPPTVAPRPVRAETLRGHTAERRRSELMQLLTFFGQPAAPRRAGSERTLRPGAIAGVIAKALRHSDLAVRAQPAGPDRATSVRPRRRASSTAAGLYVPRSRPLGRADLVGHRCSKRGRFLRSSAPGVRPARGRLPGTLSEPTGPGLCDHAPSSARETSSDRGAAAPTGRAQPAAVRARRAGPRPAAAA